MKNAQTIWLACGENCMPINVLRRHSKVAPSTPYSAGRSDVEQFEYFEKNQYSNFLSKSYIVEANAYSSNCYLNIACKSSGPCYPGRHRFLEFTHHNPLEAEDKLTLKRRINRMIMARTSNQQHCLFYHHRSSQGFQRSKDFIKQKMINILNYHQSSTISICYSQSLVKNENERGVDIVNCADGRIFFCTLKTLRPWSGDNLDEFFGKVDDDLFRKVFDVQEKMASLKKGV